MKRNHALACQLIVSGLKCDRPGCGFIQRDIPFNPPNIRAWAGARCPWCGSVLLTLEDARTSLVLYRVVGVFNFIFLPWMVLKRLLELCGLLKRKPDALIVTKMDGSGSLRWTRKDQ